MNEDAAPMIEVTRGAMVESRHRGHAVIIDNAGHPVEGWGDVNLPIYPRSAIKCLQALALVESGGADKYNVDSRELAIAMASHHSEPIHAETVGAWLARLGLDETALGCGARRPLHDAVWEAYIREGTTYTPRYDQCSGKHTGMLTAALAMGAPVKGYLQPTHPVQQRILGILERMSAQDLADAPWGWDGCAAPNWAISLGGLAMAMANFGCADNQPAQRQEACERLRAAWAAEPYMVGGARSIDTHIATVTKGRILTKGGAEGVALATIPQDRLGIALKIEDGAHRAAEAALLAILKGLDAFSKAEREEIDAWADGAVRNGGGVEVGRIRTAPSFPDSLAGNDSPL